MEQISLDHNDSCRHGDRHTLVCRESEAVLRMVLTPDMSGIWVATRSVDRGRR